MIPYKGNESLSGSGQSAKSQMYLSASSSRLAAIACRALDNN